MNLGPSGVCDVVVPVYGALDAADDCLRSVLAYTPLLSRVIVVDDASDPHVAACLDGFARQDARVLVLHHAQNLGFVRACNRGLQETRAAFVCILNSDTIVTPGWLEAMVRCARTDPRIAVVNPLSNAAVNLTVQMAPGLDIFAMAEAVASRSRRDHPDVVTGVGFCFMLTRDAVERFGGFDEAYGHGYCEESDYCMRVTDAGMRVVVADDAFVFHRGGASFDRSRERYLHNRRIFDGRWGKRYSEEYSAFMARDPLGYMRARLEHGLAEGQQAPPAVSSLWEMTIDAWRKGGVGHLVRKVPAAVGHLTALVGRSGAKRSSAHVLSRRGAASVDPEQRRSLFATPEYTRQLPRGRGLRIGVLVWRFDLAGGVLAIVDLVNHLVLAGHTVVLATLDDRNVDAALTLYSRPLVFRSEEDLADGLPELDLLVATFWPTAARWLPLIRRRRRTPAVYFVQDYEAWFLPESDTENRRRVVDSYQEADVLIVTTEWLREKVAQHGHEAAVIPYGIDHRVFYPRRRPVVGPEDARRTKRILVPARPGAPWRGFKEAIIVLDRLSRRRADVEIVFFGCTDDALAASRVPFPFRNAGALFARHAVAALYSESDILFDPSIYQAFGLPGLEAMACGVPVVLPRQGGSDAYAEHERNALVVDSGDANGRVAAIERLLDDSALRVRLAEQGLTTAARFTLAAMTRRHLEVYLSTAGQQTSDLAEKAADGS